MTVGVQERWEIVSYAGGQSLAHKVCCPLCWHYRWHSLA